MEGIFIEKAFRHNFINHLFQRHKHIHIKHMLQQFGKSELAAWLTSGNAYSYFNANTGIMVAARKAGYNPEIIPMIVEKISAKSGNQNGV